MAAIKLPSAANNPAARLPLQSFNSARSSLISWPICVRNSLIS